MEREIHHGIYLPVACHALLSLAGFWFHMGLHPPGQSLTFWWAAPMSAVSFVLLPLLFLNGKTVGLGVLMNGFSVCAGAVGMIFYGFQHPPESGLIRDVLSTTAAPVALLLAKLFLAHQIWLESRGRLV